MPSENSWDSLLLAFDVPGMTWDMEAVPTPHPPMPNDNRISAEVTAAQVTAIMTKITEIKALMPFLLNLTKDERRSLPKLGPSSLNFDEQCKAYMASAPNLVPPFVVAAEVNKDRDLRLVLADINREVKKLCEMVDDTRLTLGNEIWMADLSFYHTVKMAARRDVPGADTVYDDLKSRFPGNSGDEELPDEEEDPPTPPTP